MRSRPLHLGATLLPLLALVQLLMPVCGLCVKAEKELLPKIEKDEGAPIHIEADSLTYDRQKDQYIAEGRVEILRGGMTLRADRVVLDLSTRLANAEGKVEVIQEGSKLQSERLEINIDDQTGKVINGHLFFEPYNLTVYGEEIHRLSENRYRVVGGTLSTCSGPVPDWRFTAREMDLTVEGLAEARHATFDVRNVPLLYLPYLAYPALTQRKTGFLLPEYRSNSRIGYGLSLPFFWAFDQSYDATFTQTYFTKRGYHQGVEFRYAPWEWLHGSVDAEYIHDMQEPDLAINNRGGPRKEDDRWRFRMEQAASLPGGVVSRGKLDVVSDNYYLEDFSPDNDERYLRYLTSVLNATKRWDMFLLAGEGRYFRDLVAPDDDNSRTPQKLPSLLFHKAQLPVFGLPVALGWDTSFDHFWRDEGSTAQILGLAPGISVPLRLAPWLTLVPYASWAEKVFFTQDDLQGNGDGRLAAYGYGASLSTELFRSYPVELAKVQSLKHTIQPELRFDVMGRSIDGDWPEEFLEWFRHDRLISMVLTQFLTGKGMTKEGGLRFREFGRLRLVQSYSLREAQRDLSGPDDERREFLPLEADLELRLMGDTEGVKVSSLYKGPWAEPRSYLVLKLSGDFDWYDADFTDAAATIKGGDSRGDGASLSYRLVRDLDLGGAIRKQIQGGVGVRTIPTLDVLGQAWYDIEREDFIRYGYGLLYHPACWAVRFSHMIEPGYLGRPTDHSLRFQVYLLGLGQIGSF